MMTRNIIIKLTNKIPLNKTKKNQNRPYTRNFSENQL